MLSAQICAMVKIPEATTRHHMRLACSDFTRKSEPTPLRSRPKKLPMERIDT